MSESKTPSLSPSLWSRYRFAISLSIIAVVGLAIRVIYSARVTMQQPLSGDAMFFYYWGAVQLARGYGYLNYATLTYNYPTPGAHHPPAFTTLLAGLYRLGLHSPNQMRLALCVMGTLTIVLVGVLAAKLISKRAGLIAAALCALYPNIWLSDTILWSETLVIFAFTLALCGFYAFHRRPTIQRLGVISIALTIAAMTRAEMIVLFPAVLVPLVAFHRSIPRFRRVVWIGVAAILPIATMGAWTAYNASRFSKPVMLSTGFGPTALAGACNAVFSGPLIGSKSIPCTARAYEHPRDSSKPGKDGLTKPSVYPPMRSAHYFARYGDLPPAYWDTSIKASTRYVDESVDSARARKLWWEYTTKHSNRLPRVVLAREGRLVGLWNPTQQNKLDQFDGRGPYWILAVSQWMFWILALGSIYGAVLWRRRRIPLYPMVVVTGLVVIMSGLVFGLTRYRAAIEVAIVLLAATAIDHLATLSSNRRRARDGSGDRDDAHDPDARIVADTTAQSDASSG